MVNEARQPSARGPNVYGLSGDIDLSFLRDRELEHVTIGVYQVWFGFDKDVTISVESQFRFFDGQREWVWQPEPGAAQIAAQTLALLGTKIERFEGHANGTLELAFPNGCILSFLDSSSQYESYQITRPGQTIIV
jgi:Family of unknown function (DUF6188)